MTRKMFHTQEKRGQKLSEARKCEKDNAWLGSAWYFWYDIDDAVHWGISSKRGTGYYEIYSANIDCSNILDTVFNEEDYQLWLKAIKKAELRFLKAGKTPTLKLINDFFIQHSIWSQFSGIMFQDISNNTENYIVTGFQYKKRIQLAVYHNETINSFVLDSEGKCV